MASRSILALGLSLVVAAVIAFLTLTPISAPQLQSFQEGDKIYHAIAFAGLVLPVALFRPDRLLVAIPVHAAFGGLIEIIQPFVGRERSFHDWIAGLVGIGIGIGVGLALAVILRNAPAGRSSRPSSSSWVSTRGR